MKYGIWCVSNGPMLGRREAWLKKNREIQLFDTKDEAEAQAESIRKRITNIYNQQYFVKEYLY